MRMKTRTTTNTTKTKRTRTNKRRFKGAAEQAALFFDVLLFVGRIENRAKQPAYSRYAVIARKRLLMVV